PASLTRLGIPSTEISSSGSYCGYRSVFDNFNWFKQFADPDFAYEQQMARVYGSEAIRMVNADVLPLDYEEYGKEIVAYLNAAKKKAENNFGEQALDFREATEAAQRFEQAGA